jgi:hypothetical protein
LHGIAAWEEAMIAARNELSATDQLSRVAGKAVLQVAAVEIQRARFNGSPIYVGALTARLRREYPECNAPECDLRSEIASLAALEAVPVVDDSVPLVLGDSFICGPS